jgi:hypothetical protein
VAGGHPGLLDLAQALGEPRYLAWATELAGCLHAHAVEIDSRLLVPGEDGSTAHAGYNTSLAGIIDFLLRLRYGGPRLWLPAPDLAPAGIPVPGAARHLAAGGPR